MSSRRFTIPIVALVAIAACPGHAVAALPDRAAVEAGEPAPDRLVALLSGRLFPLLSAEAEKDRIAALTAQPDVAAMLRARAERRSACGGDPQTVQAAMCAARAMIWSDAETTALIAAFEKIPAFDRPLIPDDGLAAGLRREIAGLNTLIGDYALGAVPSYPLIDGPGIPADGAEAQIRLRAALAIAQTPREGSVQAFDPSIEFGLALLDVNDRIDAIGFEPLSKGLNAPAMARAKRLNWRRYRYSAMIVPGSGPEVPDMALSPRGKLHLRLAADRFARGDIPFIIVSGGRAHPRATRFTEAEEMRKALIERHGVPADAIVIEPYARHTTTNLRNATRLLVMMGAPLDRPTLIVANTWQSGYIEGAVFAERNRTQLGYEPGHVGQRLSPTEIEFLPSPLSLRIDPHDPLDP